MAWVGVGESRDFQLIWKAPSLLLELNLIGLPFPSSLPTPQPSPSAGGRIWLSVAGVEWVSSFLAASGDQIFPTQMLAFTFLAGDWGAQRVGLQGQRWRGERRGAGGGGGACRTLLIFPPRGKRRGWQGTPNSNSPTPSSPEAQVQPPGFWAMPGTAGSRVRGPAVRGSRLWEPGAPFGGAAALPGSLAGSLLPSKAAPRVQVPCQT